MEKIYIHCKEHALQWMHLMFLPFEVIMYDPKEYYPSPSLRESRGRLFPY